MISKSQTFDTLPRLDNDCGDCFIRHKAICSKSDAHELARLNLIKTYVDYQPNQMIIYSGDTFDHVGTLVSGMAEISMTLQDGRRQILGLLMPGDFIGRPDRIYSKYDIRAIDQVKFCRFKRKDFKSMLDQSPSLSHRLYEKTMDELDATRSWMLLLGRKTAQEKLASLLFMIATKHKGLSPHQQDYRFEFTLLITREMIADYLGLRVETVSRQITALKNKGIISLKGQRQFSRADIRLLLKETGDLQMAELLDEHTLVPPLRSNDGIG